jgi:hypothetical protein
MMNPKIWLMLLMAVIYFALIPAARGGYGYMGYNGYHSSPSFWYWGAPNTYYERSNRSGSISGTNRLGGGPESGK